ARRQSSSTSPAPHLLEDLARPPERPLRRTRLSCACLDVPGELSEMSGHHALSELLSPRTQLEEKRARVVEPPRHRLEDRSASQESEAGRVVDPFRRVPRQPFLDRSGPVHVASAQQPRELPRRPFVPAPSR